MSNRPEQVGSLLKKEVAAYILNEGFEDLTGLLTVTHAEVTADLEHAKIFVSVIGQDEEQVLKILRKHVYEMQGMLNKKLVMRKTPRIAFFPDHSGEYASRISQVIKNLHGHKN